VSGFAVSPEDVVQVKQGENIVVSTSADLKTHEVKVTNTQGQLVDLLPLSSNMWSLQGLTPGVYKLDVIADMSSSGIMGAFETVLVILGPGQQLLPPTQYITMIQSVSVKTDIIFKEDSNECSNSPGSANMGFPYENVSECEVKGAEDCRKNKIDSNYCEGLKERFRDDCEGFKNKQECDEWWEKESKRVYCMENYGMPCCDEANTPSGDTCYDEGDPDDCEPGFIDKGFGCEPEDQDIIDQCPPGSAPIDWCTHLCNEPEYKDDPECNPNINPGFGAIPIEPSPEPPIESSPEPPIEPIQPSPPIDLGPDPDSGDNGNDNENNENNNDNEVNENNNEDNEGSESNQESNQESSSEGNTDSEGSGE